MALLLYDGIKENKSKCTFEGNPLQIPTWQNESLADIKVTLCSPGSLRFVWHNESTAYVYISYRTS